MRMYQIFVDDTLKEHSLNSLEDAKKLAAPYISTKLPIKIDYYAKVPGQVKSYLYHYDIGGWITSDATFSCQSISSLDCQAMAHNQ